MPIIRFLSFFRVFFAQFKRFITIFIENLKVKVDDFSQSMQFCWIAIEKKFSKACC